MSSPIFFVVKRVAEILGVLIERSALQSLDDTVGNQVQLETLGRQLGITFISASLDPDEAQLLLDEQFPVLILEGDNTWWVFSHKSARGIHASKIENDIVAEQTLSGDRFAKLLQGQAVTESYVAKKELNCATLSADTNSRRVIHSPQTSVTGPHHAHHAPSPKPLKRFWSLLRLDWRDIWTLAVFAVVTGVLSLATPLAVEALVNVVSWGTYTQPLLILALILFTCLALAGFLGILQVVIVELIQRRQFVRIVGDFAHRFPRANRQDLEAEHPRELANRFFEIMTLQKSTAVLLLDGLTIVLTTAMGMLLLGFYHPFLLGFDLVLLFTMISVTWLLGRGGVRTAIEESVIKYEIAHWLQDVLASPSAFKLHGGATLAIERANRLTTEYLTARQRQFRVLLRQVAFSIGLQVIASTILLGLGGWLVINQQLTIGQLVASELVVTVVVGAFAKAGKSLEKFYDAMAAIDKIGHLLDMRVDPHFNAGSAASTPMAVRWESLEFHVPGAESHYKIGSASINPNSRVAICGADRTASTLLMRALVGLTTPQRGLIEIAGLEPIVAAHSPAGSIVGYAGQPEIFRGTINENISLGRQTITSASLREALVQCELWDAVLRFPLGSDTMLQTNGYPLSHSHRLRISLARAIAGKPKLLLIDGILDELEPTICERIWDALAKADSPWTLLIVTDRPELIAGCDQRIDLSNGLLR